MPAPGSAARWLRGGRSVSGRQSLFLCGRLGPPRKDAGAGGAAGEVVRVVRAVSVGVEYTPGA